jgi:hypothetical protein
LGTELCSSCDGRKRDLLGSGTHPQDVANSFLARMPPLGILAALREHRSPGQGSGVRRSIVLERETV